MAITNGYCTRADLKVALAIGTADSADDAVLDDIINTTSRLIDEYTGQFFYTIAGGTAYYEPHSYEEVEVDPLTSVTSIAVDTDGDGVWETVLGASDYILEPVNAAMFGKPYTYIELAPSTTVAFPADLDKGVKIIANFGWSAIPPQVVQACIIASSHLYEARKAYLGVIGNNDTGGVIRLSQRLHAEAALLLESFKSYRGMAV
mgnify:CR=1 FL=1|tara:strand:- start:2735 stop:3346 length:612 start_codon:yes stop_codon:yes gene_type:complete